MIDKSTKQISVIIPVHNEQGNVLPLFIRLRKTLQAICPKSGFEIIFVDDNSADNTGRELDSILDPRLVVIAAKKRQTKALAIDLGINASKYDIIATIDGDLQNFPEDIAEMLDLIGTHCDFVCGVRVDRKDGRKINLASQFANYVRRLILKDPFRDINCGLRVFKKDCYRKDRVFKGAHRFLPFFSLLDERRVVEHPVRHQERFCGKSKYGIVVRAFVAFYHVLWIRMKWGKISCRDSRSWSVVSWLPLRKRIQKLF